MPPISRNKLAPETRLPANVETPTGDPVGRLRRRGDLPVMETVWARFIGLQTFQRSVRIWLRRDAPRGSPRGVSTLAGSGSALSAGFADGTGFRMQPDVLRKPAPETVETFQPVSRHPSQASDVG